jgi:hypothetical protein
MGREPIGFSPLFCRQPTFKMRWCKAETLRRLLEQSEAYSPSAPGPEEKPKRDFSLTRLNKGGRSDTAIVAFGRLSAEMRLRQ